MPTTRKYLGFVDPLSSTVDYRETTVTKQGGKQAGGQRLISCTVSENYRYRVPKSKNQDFR